MHAILFVVLFLANGAQYQVFPVEAARCEEARAEFIARFEKPDFAKVRAVCVYEADPA